LLAAIFGHFSPFLHFDSHTKKVQLFFKLTKIESHFFGKSDIQELIDRDPTEQDNQVFCISFQK